jgi:hypothetical protein
MRKSIIINPEIIAQVLKNNESDVYVLWAISKVIDIDGSGIISTSEIINIASKIFKFKSNFIYEKIKKGVGLYWTNPSGKIGHKTICLYSINKIVERLNPNITRSKPVVIPVSIFQNASLKTIKELFIAIFASRHDDSRPMSIETISFYTGLSESTVRNALKNCQHLEIKNNFEALNKNASKTRYVLNTEQQKDIKIYRMIQDGTRSILCRQIANSYRLKEFEKLPLRTRPKSLKKIDKEIVVNLTPRQYFIKRGKIFNNSDREIL